MKRRNFIILLGGLVVWPYRAEAQGTQKVWRVGHVFLPPPARWAISPTHSSGTWSILATSSCPLLALLHCTCPLWDKTDMTVCERRRKTLSRRRVEPVRCLVQSFEGGHETTRFHSALGRCECSISCWFAGGPRAAPSDRFPQRCIIGNDARVCLRLSPGLVRRRFY